MKRNGAYQNLGMEFKDVNGVLYKTFKDEYQRNAVYCTWYNFIRSKKIGLVYNIEKSDGYLVSGEQYYTIVDERKWVVIRLKHSI